jgi:hypothetical protein
MVVSMEFLRYGSIVEFREFREHKALPEVIVNVEPLS